MCSSINIDPHLLLGGAILLTMTVHLGYPSIFELQGGTYSITGLLLYIVPPHHISLAVAFGG